MPVTGIPFISVVVPAYNEERGIGECLRRLAAFFSLKHCRYEILVCTDGSRDRTDDTVRAFAKANPSVDVKLLASEKNQGKGGAVRHGVLAALGGYILVTDVDLSSPAKEADKLFMELASGADVAIGSRALRSPGADVQQSFKRRLSGRIFNLFVRALVLEGFADTQCGFKAFRREAAQKLFTEQKLDGFSFDVEILCLAVRAGMNVREVPVMWKEGRHSKIHLVKDSVSMVGQLFELRKRFGGRRATKNSTIPAA